MAKPIKKLTTIFVIIICVDHYFTLFEYNYLVELAYDFAASPVVQLVYLY